MANNGRRFCCCNPPQKKKEKGHLIKPLLVALLVTSTCREFSKGSYKRIDLAHVAKPQAEDSVLLRMYTMVGRKISRTIFPKSDCLDVPEWTSQSKHPQGGR